MPAIARVFDMHTCPMTNPAPASNPHVGGPIQPAGVPTVFAGGQAVAVVGNPCLCTGPPDAIQAGSSSVFVGGIPVARRGDATVHRLSPQQTGKITVGLESVQVGG